jgi:hypothetical protein
MPAAGAHALTLSEHEQAPWADVQAALGTSTRLWHEPAETAGANDPCDGVAVDLSALALRCFSPQVGQRLAAFWTHRRCIKRRGAAGRTAARENGPAVGTYGGASQEIDPATGAGEVDSQTALRANIVLLVHGRPASSAQGLAACRASRVARESGRSASGASAAVVLRQAIRSGGAIPRRIPQAAEAASRACTCSGRNLGSTARA